MARIGRGIGQRLLSPSVKEELSYWGQHPMQLFLLSVFPAVGGTQTATNAVTLAVLTIFLIFPTWMLLSVLGRRMKRWQQSLTAAGCSAVMMTAFALLTYAYRPDLLAQLGLYIFLSVMTPTAALLSDTGRFEYAPGRAALDALIRCVGHGIIFVLCGIIREILAYGALCGRPLGWFDGMSIPLMAKPFGGFIVLSVLAAAVQGALALAAYIASRREKEASE